jgi:hypothetical protein
MLNSLQDREERSAREYLWRSRELEFCQDIWVEQYLRASLFIGYFVGFLEKKSYLLERAENKSNIIKLKQQQQQQQQSL